MKSVKNHLIFIVGWVLASCSEDPPYNPFVGTWIYVSITYTQCDNASDNGVFEYECNLTDCETLTFQSNRKLIYESTKGGTTTTTEGSYSFEEDKLTLCSTGCNDPLTFLVSPNSLSLIREDDAGCTVTTLLEKTL